MPGAAVDNLLECAHSCAIYTLSGTKARLRRGCGIDLLNLNEIAFQIGIPWQHLGGPTGVDMDGRALLGQYTTAGRL